MADGGVVDLLSSDSEDGANDADPEVGAEIRLAEQEDGVEMRLLLSGLLHVNSLPTLLIA